MHLTKVIDISFLSPLQRFQPISLICLLCKGSPTLDSCQISECTNTCITQKHSYTHTDVIGTKSVSSLNIQHFMSRFQVSTEVLVISFFPSFLAPFLLPCFLLFLYFFTFFLLFPETSVFWLLIIECHMPQC